MKKIFRLFKSEIPEDIYLDKLNFCYDNIKAKIFHICGVSSFIENDSYIAFSGSIEEPQLILTLNIMKSNGEKYLYADLDDEISWQEWDF